MPGDALEAWSLWVLGSRTEPAGAQESRTEPLESRTEPAGALESRTEPAGALESRTGPAGALESWTEQALEDAGEEPALEGAREAQCLFSAGGLAILIAGRLALVSAGRLVIFTAGGPALAANGGGHFRRRLIFGSGRVFCHGAHGGARNTERGDEELLSYINF